MNILSAAKGLPNLKNGSTDSITALFFRLVIQKTILGVNILVADKKFNPKI